MRPAGLSMSGPWNVCMFTPQLLTRDVVALVLSGSWIAGCRGTRKVNTAIALLTKRAASA